MRKRLYLLILFAVTLFCGCKNSNPLDSTTKVSFSIPARVLEDVGNNNGEDILVCTQVLRGSKVIIDEKYERKLFFDENNKPYIESVVLEDIPLYTSLVLKMQIFVGEELFAEGQSEKTLFTEGKNTLNLQLKLIPKDDDEDDDPEPEDPADPEIELKINQTSITVEEWEESATFTATEGFDSYNWSCGDQTQTGSKSSFTIVKTSLREGVYIVRLIATKDGIEYSAETSLTVVKPNGSSGISFEVVHTDVTIAVEEDDNDILFETDFGYDSYKWIIAGKDDYDNSPFCSISKDSLGEGVYIVRLIATKDGREYSAEGRLSVELPKRSSEISFEVVHTDITIAVAEERDNAILFETDFGYDSYKWIIAGNDDYDNSPSCPIRKDSLGEGVYIVRLIATKDGREYSAEGKLTVDLPNGPSGFSIDVVENADIYFDVEFSSDYSKITFVTYENCDSYYWTCGNKSGNEKTFTIEKSDFDGRATYLIRLVVYKDGREYSCEQLFSISE